MRPFFPILPALWISLSVITFGGCQNRAPSLRMLDARAGYSAGSDDEEVALYQKGRINNESLARKSAPRVARVYIYPHELPSKDYFWGGYVSLVVSPDEWIFEDINGNQTGAEDLNTPAIQALPKNLAPQIKKTGVKNL